MKTTILPPEGFDPVALAEPDLRVEVIPWGGVNETLATVTLTKPDGTVWNREFVYQLDAAKGEWTPDIDLSWFLSDAPPEFIQDASTRIAEAITSFVSEQPGVFGNRWKLQAYLKVAEARAVQKMEIARAIEESAYTEHQKLSLDAGPVGLFHIGSRDVWQQWSSAQRRDQAAWSKSGIQALGVECSELRDMDTAEPVYMIAITDPAIQQALRAAGDAAGGFVNDVVFEFRPGDGDAVSLLAQAGAPSAQGALLESLRTHARACVSSFLDRYPSAGSRLAKRAYPDACYTSDRIEAMTPSLDSMVGGDAEMFAAVVGMTLEELEALPYRLKSVPTEPVSELAEMAQALDASGAHTIAEEVMGCLRNGEETSHLFRQLDGQMTTPGIIAKGLLDVADPVIEERLVAFVTMSLEQNRNAFHRSQGI